MQGSVIEQPKSTPAAARQGTLNRIGGFIGCAVKQKLDQRGGVKHNITQAENVPWKNITLHTVGERNHCVLEME